MSNKAVKKKKREKNKTLIRGVNLVKNSENGEKINPIIKIEKGKTSLLGVDRKT